MSSPCCRTATLPWLPRQAQLPNERLDGALACVRFVCHGRQRSVISSISERHVVFGTAEYEGLARGITSRKLRLAANNSGGGST